MFSTLAIAALLLPLAAAVGSIRFPVVQDDIRFNSAVDSIKSSQVADLLSALNGYDVQQRPGGSVWKGLRSYNPLRHPTLFLVADFELGSSMIELIMNSNLRFKLDNDNQLDAEFSIFKSRSIHRWPEAEGRMQAVDTGVNDSEDAQIERLREAISLLRDERFEASKQADRAFLLEYYTLKGVVSDAAKAPVDDTPSTVYWLKLNSLHALADEYGQDHKKTQRAVQLFSQLIGTTTGVLESHPRSLFMVIQEESMQPSSSANVSGAPKRVRRDLNVQEPTAPTETRWNLAHQYDGDYPVVFATTAFTLFVIVLGVYATSIGLWFMDPGRDSIIYRMTSQRMKMD
ncbi:renin receptor-like [Varroa jacobsoni]|uniref:Renin receptor n=1 Tax=Varroa destructor TaxID=109461 RepID=A0A7M7KMR9_VARDE|nr:renin receptor-like [Varroa destructor]XP_022701538.1 renin receptor-like [Varroa jacobsoni]